MINHQLCGVYPALSPFDVDKQTFHDVIKLYIDVINTLETNQEEDSKPAKPMRRPAGDDWF